MDSSREGSTGGFGIVEGDDKDVVLVCKRPVPLVVVSDVSDTKATAVDGEESWEGDGRGLVVGFREEDAVPRIVSRRYRVEGGKIGALTGLEDLVDIRIP